MRVAIVTFPGSNCDYDCFKAVTDVLGEDAYFVWHREESVGDCDVVILPGGFSYGDYLRAGAIARFSPIMKDVQRFADEGGIVLGICNGFQILCEAGLLPGALLRNRSLQFQGERVRVRVLHLRRELLRRVEDAHHAVEHLPAVGRAISRFQRQEVG